MRTMKGQMNIQNWIVLVVTFFAAIIFMPVINSISDDVAIALLVSPNPMTALTIAAIRLIPIAIIVMCIITGIYWALPRREEGQMQ